MGTLGSGEPSWWFLQYRYDPQAPYGCNKMCPLQGNNYGWQFIYFNLAGNASWKESWQALDEYERVHGCDELICDTQAPQTPPTDPLEGLPVSIVPIRPGDDPACPDGTTEATSSEDCDSLRFKLNMDRGHGLGESISDPRYPKGCIVTGERATTSFLPHQLRVYWNDWTGDPPESFQPVDMLCHGKTTAPSTTPTVAETTSTGEPEPEQTGSTPEPQIDPYRRWVPAETAGANTRCPAGSKPVVSYQDCWDATLELGSQMGTLGSGEPSWWFLQYRYDPQAPYGCNKMCPLQGNNYGWQFIYFNLAGNASWKESWQALDEYERVHGCDELICDTQAPQTPPTDPLEGLPVSIVPIRPGDDPACPDGTTEATSSEDCDSLRFKLNMDRGHGLGESISDPRYPKGCIVTGERATTSFLPHQLRVYWNDWTGDPPESFQPVDMLCHGKTTASSTTSTVAETTSTDEPEPEQTSSSTTSEPTPPNALTPPEVPGFWPQKQCNLHGMILEKPENVWNYTKDTEQDCGSQCDDVSEGWDCVGFIFAFEGDTNCHLLMLHSTEENQILVEQGEGVDMGCFLYGRVPHEPSWPPTMGPTAVPSTKAPEPTLAPPLKPSTTAAEPTLAPPLKPTTTAAEPTMEPPLKPSTTAAEPTMAPPLWPSTQAPTEAPPTKAPSGGSHHWPVWKPPRLCPIKEIVRIVRRIHSHHHGPIR